MEIKETPSKTYVHRQVSSAVKEILTAIVMLVLGASTAIWLVYPNLLAVIGPERVDLLQYLGNLLVYILAMVVFFWMVFRHWRAARDAIDLDSQGVETQAEVIEIWGKEAKLNNEFWIAYRYLETYEGKAEVRKKHAIGFQPGELLHVRLLERNPHVHRLVLDKPKDKAN